MKICNGDNMKNYYIREYDGFIKKSENIRVSEKYVPMEDKTFDALEQFILSNKNNDEVDPIELMTISSKKGIGKVISAKNYVGLIQMKDGTKIEILPKIYVKGNSGSKATSRRIFLNMLRTLKEFPFKKFNYSSLDTMNNTIYEIFISMFIEEVIRLAKKGLKSSYILHEDNENFYKGKVMFSEHIKKNLAHKEKFYIAYDDFSINRSENKIIKSTLTKLMKMSNSNKNIKDITKLLIMFDKVDKSINYEKDFANIKLDRNMNEYSLILKWCKVFLLNKSFNAFSGEEVAHAILFPMEKVFESYVANILKQQEYTQRYSIVTQDSKYSLFDTPKKFKLQPDIVITKEDTVFIMDTKWKILDSDYNNYGISQNDMYQMYAYSKKYNAKKVFLLYPYSEWIKDENDNIISYMSNDNVNVEIAFIDLENPNESVEKLINRIN